MPLRPETKLGAYEILSGIGAGGPSGKELFYRSGDRMMAVPVVQTDGGLILGRPAVLFQGRFFYHSLGSYDVTPDGQRFVLIDESEAEPAPTHLVLVQNFSEVLKRLVPPN